MSHLIASLARMPGRFSLPPPRHSGGKDASMLEVWTRLLQIVQALQRGDTLLITKMIRETSRTASERGLTCPMEANRVLLGGTSILHLAVQCAEIDVIEYVLSHRSEHIDINILDKYKQTPLRVATIEGRTAVVDLLSRYGATEICVVEGKRSSSPLRYLRPREFRKSIH